MTGNYGQGQLNETAVLFPAALLQSVFNPLIVDRERKEGRPAKDRDYIGGGRALRVRALHHRCHNRADFHKFPRDSQSFVCSRGSTYFSRNGYIYYREKLGCRTVTPIRRSL